MGRLVVMAAGVHGTLLRGLRLYRTGSSTEGLSRCRCGSYNDNMSAARPKPSPSPPKKEPVPAKQTRLTYGLPGTASERAEKRRKFAEEHKETLRRLGK